MTPEPELPPRWKSNGATALKLLDDTAQTPVGLYAYVNPESWAPVWLQLCGLWLKRLAGRL